MKSKLTYTVDVCVLYSQSPGLGRLTPESKTCKQVVVCRGKRLVYASPQLSSYPTVTELRAEPALDQGTPRSWALYFFVAL
jgi:hypothetical protein